MATNLIDFPRMKICLPSLCPVGTVDKLKSEKPLISELLKRCTDSKKREYNLLTTTKVRHDIETFFQNRYTSLKSSSLSNLVAYNTFKNGKKYIYPWEKRNLS
jgi:hypothetical protein